MQVVRFERRCRRRRRVTRRHFVLDSYNQLLNVFRLLFHDRQLENKYSFT